jgi:Tol biopolymer transport system component/DNA-binding response OmpR family regulator
MSVCILIVEDEPFLSQTCQIPSQLGSGYICDVAHHWDETKSILEDRDVDIVILDKEFNVEKYTPTDKLLGNPDLKEDDRRRNQGIYILRALKEKWPYIPVIMVTQFTINGGKIIEAALKGTYSYFTVIDTKPDLIGELKIRLANLTRPNLGEPVSEEGVQSLSEFYANQWLRKRELYEYQQGQRFSFDRAVIGTDEKTGKYIGKLKRVWLGGKQELRDVVEYAASRAFKDGARHITFEYVRVNPYQDIIAFLSQFRKEPWGIYLVGTEPDKENWVTRQGVAFNVVEDFPAWAPSRMKIAFASASDRHHSEIYVANIWGEIQQVTNNGAHNIEPSWSPDARKIVFASNTLGTWDIHVVDVDSGNSHLLVKGRNGKSLRRPSWSPDGKRIAYLAETEGEPEGYGKLCIVRYKEQPAEAEGEQSSITKVENVRADISSRPSWSPDGKRIAISGCGIKGQLCGIWNIWIINADTGTTIQSTRQGEDENRIVGPTEVYLGPIWSPKGDKIAFTVLGVEAGRNYSIRVWEPGSMTLTITDNRGGMLPAWAPEGDRIAFVSGEKRTDYNRIYIAKMASFVVTDQSLENLKSEKVPDDVLEKLEGIKDQEIMGEKEFLGKLKTTLGDEQTVKFKSLILKHALVVKPLDETDASGYISSYPVWASKLK